MTYATVRRAAEHIARAGKITPHQLAALTRLDEMLSDEQRQQFTDLWRVEGSPAAKVAAPIYLAPALKIIKQFEGCKLAAYKCPAGVWTIGWGATIVNGAAVREGDKISQPLADELLIAEALRIAAQLHEIIPASAKWGANQQAALISWAYNVGLGAVKDSTLRKRINAGEGGPVVIPQELPKWNKASGQPLAGLTRRRAAEVAMFTGQDLQQPAKVAPGSPFSTRLTPHITLGEFALGQESRRFDHQHQVDTAAELAAFMERCRARFGGKAVIITSGYRPAAINRSVGGASASEHLYSAPGVGAVDFYIQGESISAVQSWVDREWPYSIGYGAPKGFVHLGIRSGRPRVRWDY
jgi:GH24 family phage-related lysozyme (muramidase)